MSKQIAAIVSGFSVLVIASCFFVHSTQIGERDDICKEVNSSKYVYNYDQIGSKRVGEYKIIGTIKDPILLGLLEDERAHQQLAIQLLNHNINSPKRAKALLLDGEQLDSRMIKQSSDVIASIKDSTPIVISKPTPEEVHSIIGAKVNRSDALVIIPEKKGEEFIIYLVNPESNIGGNFKNQSLIQSGEETTLKDMVNQHIANLTKVNKKNTASRIGGQEVNCIKSLLNIKHREREQKNVDGSQISCHKRWTVQNASPYFWGKQKQFIDVGYQYDLYFVIDPQPARKYLSVKSVGSGVSAGNMKYDTKHHKGYYQKAVTVEISKSGAPLILEGMAPQTDNGQQSNSSSVTTGIAFNPTIYTFPTGPGPSFQSGFSMSQTKGLSRTFNEFAISADSTNVWTYWLSGAQGGRVRREHSAKDLVNCKNFVKCKINDLPQLATGSLLMPHLESVFYTKASETGEVRMEGKTTQYLEEIKLTSHLLKDSINVKKRTSSKSLGIIIDLNQVGSDVEDSLY